MTEKKQDQAKADKKQTQAVELEDTKLEQAQGGISDGTSNTRTGGGGTTSIKDGLSH